MSTLVEGYPEPDSAAIGTRLRAYMGVEKISRSRLAIASGITRSSLANKLDGHVDFTVSEVIAIAHALGKSWFWVMTGRDDGRPGPDSGLLLPRLEHPFVRHRQYDIAAPAAA